MESRGAPPQVVARCPHLTLLDVSEEIGERRGLLPELRRLAALRGLCGSLRALNVARLALSGREATVLGDLAAALPLLLRLRAPLATLVLPLRPPLWAMTPPSHTPLIRRAPSSHCSGHGQSLMVVPRQI